MDLKLRATRFPSILRNVDDARQWTVDIQKELGKLVDFGMDPDQDLLVAMFSNQDYVSPSSPLLLGALKCIIAVQNSSLISCHSRLERTILGHEL